jgi:hypothetical protein
MVVDPAGDASGRHGQDRREDCAHHHERQTQDRKLGNDETVFRIDELRQKSQKEEPGLGVQDLRNA